MDGKPQHSTKLLLLRLAKNGKSNLNMKDPNSWACPDPLQVASILYFNFY